MISQPCVSGRYIPGHDQGARHQRFTEAGQDRLRNYVIRNANPDCTSLRIQHSSWHFSSRRHDEGVLAGRGGLDGTKDHVVELDESAELGEVSADEREVMPVVKLPDLSNPLQARSVIKLAAKREAGVSGIRDQPASTQQVDHLANHSGLRVVRVDIEVSGHEIERSGRQARKSVAVS